ncbi:MAG TPA: hypothetical protein EYP77_08285 [Anaerolineae bacterium]|nr:hypothetical protein [Anaerolineae bacterium]
MARKRRVILFRPHVPLYPGEDDELIAWVNSLDRLPFGAKSQAVKEALRRAVGGGSSPGRPAPAPAVDLSEIRAVVEAAVEQALARQQVSAAAATAPEEDAEVEALLDGLGASLVLGDEGS